jgi:oligoendopeptidase F
MTTAWDFEIFEIEISEAGIKKQLEVVQTLVAQHLTWSGKMATINATEWLQYFVSEEMLSKEIYRVYQPVMLRAEQEATNPDLQNLLKLVQARYVEIKTQLLPLGLEIKNLGADKLADLAATPGLSQYHNYFVQLSLSAKHALSQKEEIVINLKDQSLASNYTQMYDSLTAAKNYVVDDVSYTEGEVRSWRNKSNEGKRMQAFELLSGYYSSEEQQIVRGSVYYGIVTDWVNEAKLRGYTSPISVRNLSEEMPDTIVQDLLEGVASRYSVYQDFLAYKATQLGSTKLKYSDIFAPLDHTEANYTWEEGLDIVRTNLIQLDPQLGGYIDNLMTTKRIDVLPRAGKSGGAFASYNKFFGQYIKLNYTNDIDAVTTLAHELGHAYHGEISKDQPDQVYNTPLVLAETASTFFQLLVIDALRRDRPELSKSLITELLEDFFATVVRQVQYVRFEQKMHGIVWNGGVFGHQEANKYWASEVESMIGDKVEHTRELYQSNWSGIPHIFHTPFYCYAYSYGLLFALALYHQYQIKQDPEILWQVLRLGGSKSPAEMLEITGIESVDEMIEGGYQQIQDWIQALKS